MRMRSALLLLSIAVSAAPLEAAPGSKFAASEVARFALRGTVRDRHGQAVPGATVVAILGESKSSVVTDANGVFRFSLPSGTYRVSVAAPGFATAFRNDVKVGAGQSADLAIIVSVPVPKDHLKAKPPPIPIPPPPPPVMLEDKIETAPPPPPPAPPAPPPVAAESGAKAPPPVAAADGHSAASSLYWNQWLEGKGRERVHWVPEAPPDVAESDIPRTTVVIDLSLADLSRLAGSGVAAAPATSDLASALSDDARVMVLPVVLGDALKLDDTGWKRLRVNAERLGAAPPALPTTAPAEDTAFRDLARTASVLDKPEWSPILLKVHGMKRGCAAVALSVWDHDLTHPLDQQFFPVAVGPVKCGPMPGGSGLSAALLRRYGSGSGDYDAALHVFEMPKAKFPTTAVFVARGDPKPRVWTLGRPLSDLPEAMGPDLARARDADHYAVNEASRTLMTELFTDDRNAGAALDVLRQSRGTPGRTIYARIVTSDGKNFPLPLGLIDIGGGVPLGSVATIVTPFPRDTAGTSRSGCINQRVMISDSDKFDGIQPRPSSGLLVGAEKAIGYFGATTSDRVALVLLGHHGEATAQLVFDSPPAPITPGSLTHRFDNSVGFFMVCGLATAPTKRDMTTWLEQFGTHGIDAAVASPFEIEADTAEKFLTAVQQVLAATPSTSSISFAELYSAAIKRMDEKRAWEAFEYVVIGDGSIRLCGEGS